MSTFTKGISVALAICAASSTVTIDFKLANIKLGSSEAYLPKLEKKSVLGFCLGGGGGGGFFDFFFGTFCNPSRDLHKILNLPA